MTMKFFPDDGSFTAQVKIDTTVAEATHIHVSIDSASINGQNTTSWYPHGISYTAIFVEKGNTAVQQSSIEGNSLILNENRHTYDGQLLHIKIFPKGGQNWEKSGEDKQLI